MTAAETAFESRSNRERRRMLAFVALATLGALTVWFSTNAVASALGEELGFGDGEVAWLTIAVQFGFVAGTVASALTNLAERMNARRLFALSVLAAALANVAPVGSESFAVWVLARFLTGLFLAGVYPPGDARDLRLVPHRQGSRARRRHRRAHARLGLSASAACAAGGRMALGDGRGQRAGDARRGAHVVRRTGRPAPLLAAAGAALPLLARHLGTRALARSGGLPRAHVGAVRDVGVAARLPERGLQRARAARTRARGRQRGRLRRLRARSRLLRCRGRPGRAIRAHRSHFRGDDRQQRDGSDDRLHGRFGAAGDRASRDLGRDGRRGLGAVLRRDDGARRRALPGLGFLLTVVTIRGVPLVESAAGWGPAFALLAIGPALGTVAMLALRRRPEAAQLAGGRR